MYRTTMHTIDTAITMMVAGAQYRQYLPQVTGCPFLAATDVPTTLAEAPMGVALPPRSVYLFQLKKYAQYLQYSLR